jgi:hypothetical protein
MTPLFIPLKTKYFEEFRAGTKTTEYRIYGPRWNERTCAIGRPVVLSKGYGKSHRLTGSVTGFWQSTAATLSEAWRKCYGDRGERIAACIQIQLNAQGKSGG